MNNKTLIKLTPRGFCDGVVNSWQSIINTINNYPDKNIYMLGLFVHNNEFVNKLLIQYKNLFLLDDTFLSRYELISQKNKNFKNSILILSAHGTDSKTIKKANKKFYKVINTTCKYVNKTHNFIKECLNKKMNIVYIGVVNHPETNSCISISKKIILITNVDDLKKLDKSKSYIFINQTTLSVYDLYSYYKYIKHNFPNSIINNHLCNATLDRQNAILNNLSKFDYLIVVGSEKSNNSKSLLNLAINNNKNAILINNIDDIKKIPFKNYNSFAITAGASTPTWITNDIIEYLIKNINLMEISNND